MYRKLAATELAHFLGTLSHPLRVRIIEELKGQELDVSTIQEILQERQSKISQHLSILRSQKILTERRDGRRILYKLKNENLRHWLIDGLDLIKSTIEDNEKISKAILNAKKTWKKKI